MQPELFEPKHKSRRRLARLKKHQLVNPERVYAAAWLKLNRRDPAINGGYAALEVILSGVGRPIRPVTAVEAETAAAVIQWLGTNVGLGFIWSCERRIEELRERAPLHAGERRTLLGLKRDRARQRAERHYRGMRL